MRNTYYTPVRTILLVIAVILFLAAGFKIGLPFDAVDFGLVFFAGAFLVPWVVAT